MTTGSTGFTRSRLATLSMIVLGLLLGGAMAMGGAASLLRAHQSRDWPSVSARVLSASVDTTRVRRGAVLRAKLRYAHDVAGKHYESDRFSFSGGGLSEQEAATLVRRVPAGGVVTAHYSPADPALACIDCGKLGTMDYGVTAVGLLVVLYSLNAAWQVVTTRGYFRARWSPPPGSLSRGAP